MFQPSPCSPNHQAGNRHMTFPTAVDNFRITHLAETNSTNDDVWRAIDEDEPEGLVVVADQQLKGRGRQGRSWVTTPEASLAFSILIRPTPGEVHSLSRFSALGGLAVRAAIAELSGARPQLKWPNDVLINNKKICGILTEAFWEGSHLKGMIIGIGINITVASVPNLPSLIYPASSIESETARVLDRPTLLREVLTHLTALRPLLPTDAFIARCNEHLAFRGQVAPVRNNSGEMESFRLICVDSDGALLVEDVKGQRQRIYSGELSSPASSSSFKGSSNSSD